MRRMKTTTVGRQLSATIAALACALALAACGDDSDDKSGADPAHNLTGTPFKIMAQAAVGSPIQDYPQVFAGAKAAANAINEDGGINGHPVEIITCNDNADANGSEACARQAVAEKVAGVVGYNVGGGVSLPILEQAGIPAITQNSNEADYTMPNAWPITGGSFTADAGLGQVAKNAGIEKLALVLTDVAAALPGERWVSSGAKGAGVEFVGTVKIPIDATDFSPYIQKLKDTGADGYIFLTAASQRVPIVKTSKQLGFDAKAISWFGNLNDATLEQLGSDAEGILAAGPLPPLGSDSELTKAFTEQMDAAEDADVDAADRRDAQAEETWLSVHAMAKVAETIDGDVTGESLQKAFETVENVELFDTITWTPSTPGPDPWLKISNGIVYPGIVKDGKIVTEGDPIDASELFAAGEAQK
jgi:ABC-type branched-subunit amino acid transport system substrate-binding protein